MFLWCEDSAQIEPLDGCQIIDPQMSSGSFTFTSTLFHKKDTPTCFDHCMKELQNLKPLANGLNLHYRLPFPSVPQAEQESTLVRRLLQILPKSHFLYLNVPFEGTLKTYLGRKQFKSFLNDLPKSNSLHILFEIPGRFIEGYRFSTLSLQEMDQLLVLSKELGLPTGFLCKQEHQTERMLAQCLLDGVFIETRIEKLFEGRGYLIEKMQKLLSLSESIDDTVHECVFRLLALQEERAELDQLYSSRVLSRFFSEIRASSEQVLRKKGEKIPLGLSQVSV